MRITHMIILLIGKIKIIEEDETQKRFFCPPNKLMEKNNKKTFQSCLTVFRNLLHILKLDF